MEQDKEGWMPTCHEAHRLVSEGLDRHLGLVERGRLRVHLLACEGCRRFESQMALLRRALRSGPPEDTP